MTKSYLFYRIPLARNSLYALLFHCCFWAIFIFNFDYEPRTLVLHLAAALGCLIVFQIGLCFTVSLAESLSKKFASLLACLLQTSYVFAFTIFYGANIVSNYGWGSHISFSLLYQSIAHGSSIAETFPYIAIGLCVIATLLCVGLFIAFQRQLSRQTTEQHHEAATLIQRLAILISPIAYLALLTFFIAREYSIYEIGIWQGEPIVSLLQIQASGFEATPLRLSVASQEKKLRLSYPKMVDIDRRNVIIITVDGLRPQSMGVYGYERENTPFLSSLKKTNKMRLVNHATSPCPESVCGIMSILTSKDSPRQSHTSLALQHLLRYQGYQNIFLLSGDHSWYGLDGFYGEEINTFIDGRSDCPFGINDDRCILLYLSQLEHDQSKAYFLNIHLMSAHMVGTQLEQWKLYQPASQARFAFGKKQPVEFRNGYDNGVLQADYMISEIFKTLDQKGFLDDAIIVITADHGEALGEHSLYGHTNHLYEEFIRVPLLLIDSKDPETSDIDSASLLDIAPSILQKLGLPKPETWQGRALGEESHAQVRHFFHSTPNNKPWRGITIIDGSKKAKFLQKADDKPLEEYYDLNSDPGEKNNDLSSLPESKLQDFRDKLRRHFAM